MDWCNSFLNQNKTDGIELPPFNIFYRYVSTFSGRFAAVAKKSAHTAFCKSVSMLGSGPFCGKVTDVNQFWEHTLHIGRLLLYKWVLTVWNEVNVGTADYWIIRGKSIQVSLQVGSGRWQLVSFCSLEVQSRNTGLGWVCNSRASGVHPFQSHIPEKK